MILLEDKKAGQLLLEDKRSGQLALPDNGGVTTKSGQKTVTVNGKTVVTDNKTFDPDFIDSQGRTNAQRMKQGLAPIGTDGKSRQRWKFPVKKFFNS